MAWQRMARRVVIGLAATGGLAVLASCDPPPPPRAFTVDVSTDSVDAQENAATPPGTRPVRAHG